MNDKDLERFLDKVKILEGEDPCWEWQAGISRGYGKFTLHGKQCGAHRVSYTYYKRDPGNLYVLHKCDNRSCVNPEHLFLGTHQDNMDDMVSKGRAASKLTSNQVLEIKELLPKLNNKEIAQRYDIDSSTVSNIRYGKLHAQITNITQGYIQIPTSYCKITNGQVLEIKELLPSLNNTDIARIYNINPDSVSSIRRGRTWSDITNIKEGDFKNLSHKLTVTEVLQIKDLLYELKNIDIAPLYGVSCAAISHNRSGRRWSKVTGIKPT